MWIGRPLLAQWVADAIACVKVFDEWGPKKPLVLIAGPSPAALLAANFAPERLSAVVLVDSLVSYVTDGPYASGTRMGILAPGILKVGDIPHLAALVAPRPLQVAGGADAQGKKLAAKALATAFAFTSRIYRLNKAEERLKVLGEATPAEIVERL